MSSENNDENFSSYDEKSRKCIEKLDLTENELTTIHKALIVIKKTCNSIKNITYYNTDESAKVSCGRSFGSISFDLTSYNINDLTSDQVLIKKF